MDRGPETDRDRGRRVHRLGSGVAGLGAGHKVLTIDKLTYAGRREAIAEVMGSPRHQFVHADVADESAVDVAFRNFDPDAVLHLAAESQRRERRAPSPLRCRATASSH